MGNTTDVNTIDVDLVIIPAVQGRVVRFLGSAMHAVPKPPHKWILSPTEEANIRKQQQEDEEEYHDFNNHQHMERSVILFNCWSNDNPPPFGLKTLNAVTSKIPDGIIIDDDTDVDLDNTISSQVTTVTKEMDTMNNNWYQTKLHRINFTSVGEDDSQGTIRVRLMGNKYRHLHNKAVVQLTVNEDSFLQSLHDTKTPTYMQLHQVNDNNTR
jgi:hypothetical protein